MQMSRQSSAASDATKPVLLPHLTGISDQSRLSSLSSGRPVIEASAPRLPADPNARSHLFVDCRSPFRGGIPLPGAPLASIIQHPMNTSGAYIGCTCSWHRTTSDPSCLLSVFRVATHRLNHAAVQAEPQPQCPGRGRGLLLHGGRSGGECTS